jgi:hypothetical protein
MFSLSDATPYFTDEQWTVMENNGAIFLPASGYISVAKYYKGGDYNYGYYWTSNDYEYYNTLYRYYYFSGGGLDYKAFNSRSNSERYSVRLVKNVE